MDRNLYKYHKSDSRCTCTCGINVHVLDQLQENCGPTDLCNRYQLIV